MNLLLGRLKDGKRISIVASTPLDVQTFRNDLDGEYPWAGPGPPRSPGTPPTAPQTARASGKGQRIHFGINGSVLDRPRLRPGWAKRRPRGLQRRKWLGG
jgi:hypothetical protein